MDRIEALKEKGVRVGYDTKYVGEVGKDRHPEEVKDRIRTIEIPFSSAEWCLMCMRENPWNEEGYYIGGCCGNMSLAQDILNGAFRDGGYFEGHALLQFGSLLASHDGFEESFAKLDDEQFTKRLENWDNLDPFDKFGLVYRAVEDKLVPYRHELPRTERDPNKDAFHILANTVQSIDWGDLFTHDNPKHKQLYERTRLVKLARLLQPLRRTLTTVEEQREQFEGFAIVTPGTDELQFNGYGYCLYDNESEAEEIIEQWKRWAREDEENERETIDAEIVPVKVSIDEGVRILR